MKTLRALILVSITVIFYSCDPGSNPVASDTDSYSWSVQNINKPNAWPQLVNRNTYFATSGIGEFYKVTNGVSVKFSVPDSMFKIQQACVYDENYIVFLGYLEPGFTPGYTVFDNGAYTYYPSPTPGISSIYFSDRGVFYLYDIGPDGNQFYKFMNGKFTEYPLPEGENSLLMGKANGNNYMWRRSVDQGLISVYKITESGAILLRTESNDGALFPLNSDVIKIDSNYTYLYFTEQGWSTLFTQNNTTSFDFPIQVYGENKNLFAVLLHDNSLNLRASAWDGKNFSNQTNFPSNENASGGTIGNRDKYIDKSFILSYYGNESNKVVIGTYNGQ